MGLEGSQVVVMLVDSIQQGSLARLRQRNRWAALADARRSQSEAAEYDLQPCLQPPNYWSDWVQLVPPAGSNFMMLFSSMQ